MKSVTIVSILIKKIPIAAKIIKIFNCTGLTKREVHPDLRNHSFDSIKLINFNYIYYRDEVREHVSVEDIL